MPSGVVVDVSNVCRSQLLPGPPGALASFARLTEVIAAWRALPRHAEDRVICVADRSLRRHLTDGERIRWRHLTKDMIVVGHADPALLHIACDRDYDVLSGDMFREYRVEHPWLEQRPTRVHAWTIIRDAVRIEPVRLTPLGAEDQSLIGEQAALREHRLDPVRDRHILASVWRCDHGGCLQSALFPGPLRLWPNVDDEGNAICPSCEHRLNRVGPRTQVRELVISSIRDGRTVQRLPIELEQTVILGRDGKNGVDITATLGDRKHALRISRQHLQVTLTAGRDNPRLVIRDLASANGTKRYAWTGATFATPELLPPDRDVTLTSGDQLELAGAAVVRLSGQRFNPDPPAPATPVDADLRRTVRE